MTDKQVLETLQNEYNKLQDTYVELMTMNDGEFSDIADAYWHDAEHTAHIIKLLFGDDYDAFDAYLDYIAE